MVDLAISGLAMPVIAHKPACLIGLSRSDPMVCVKWVRNGNLDMPKFKALKIHYESIVFS